MIAFSLKSDVEKSFLPQSGLMHTIKDKVDDSW